MFGLLRKHQYKFIHPPFQNKPGINIDVKATCFTLVFNYVELFMLLTIPIRQIYALGNGETRTMWEDIGGRISILRPKQYELIDWSMYVSLLILWFY